MNNHEAAIVTAYTGILAGSFSVFHEYAEKLLNRPIQTFEFAEREIWEKLKELSRDDFVKLTEAADA